MVAKPALTDWVEKLSLVAPKHSSAQPEAAAVQKSIY